MKAKSELLVKVTRGNLTETEHLGYVVVVDKNENIVSKIGDTNNLPFFIRSCAKPFQALPIISSGTHVKYNLSSSELAICTSSHSGSNMHTTIVKGILNKTGLSEKDLECGCHEPIDLDEKNHLIKNSLNCNSLHNNCSGKHAGMLSVCLTNNWDTRTYLDFNHQLQQEILGNIRKYCNMDSKMESSLDNCSAPVHGLPLSKLGAGYLRIFSSPEGQLLRKAFIENPFVIGGNGRVDSLIMNVAKGRLIAKTGADGLCVVANLEKEQALVVKVMDADSLIRKIVVFDALKQLGWLSEEDLKDKEIQRTSKREIKTLKDVTVGKIEPLFSL